MIFTEAGKIFGIFHGDKIQVCTTSILGIKI